MKKAKLLIAVAAAAIGVTAVSAVAVSAADGKLGTVLHAARAEVEQLDPAAGEGMFFPGNAAYLGIKTEKYSGTWDTADAEFRIGYFSQNDGCLLWTEPATLVEGYDIENGGYRLYETVVPELPDEFASEIHWSKLIAARFYKGYNPNGDSEWYVDDGLEARTGRYGDNNAQTSDILYTDTIGNNLLKVYENRGGGSVGKDIVRPQDRLVVWAGTTGWWGTGEGANNVCDPDGNTDEVELAAKWGASALTYENLGYDVKAYFSNLDWTNPTEEHLANNVAHQYDFIIKKYVTLNNFAMRNSLA